MPKVPNEDGLADANRQLASGHPDRRILDVDDYGFSIYPFDAWLRMRGVDDTVEAPVEEVR